MREVDGSVATAVEMEIEVSFLTTQIDFPLKLGNKKKILFS